MPSSPGQAILGSPHRTIPQVTDVSRSNDDISGPRSYGSAMRWRLDPARLDVVLAGVLLVIGEVQVAFNGAHGWLLLSEVVTAGAVTGSVAIRRRHPAAVGIGVQALMVAEGQLARLPAGAVTVAWFCALYALAVWTTSQWFAAGLAFFVASSLLPSMGDPATLRAIANFTAGAVLVMAFLRILVGRRDRQLAIAERERDLTRREAVVAPYAISAHLKSPAWMPKTARFT